MKTPKKIDISRDNTVEIIEFLPTAAIIETKLRDSKSDITIVPIENGEALIQKKSRYNTKIQIIEGKTEVVIDNNPILLESGQSITVHANKSSKINLKDHFKMVQTVVKD